MAVTIHGSGSISGLSIPASSLTGALPAIDGSSLTGISSVTLEHIAGVADGSTITTPNGSYTMANVTGGQNIGTTYVDVTGSVISYVPPADTTKVIYRFSFMSRWESAHAISHYKFYLDGTEVTSARFSSASQYNEQFVNFEWVINIGDGTDTADGKLSTWTTNKIMKVMGRDYGGSNGIMLHQTRYWDGADNAQLHKPTLTVTAIK